MKTYFSLAINNLRRRKLRSWLTVLGIFIGIAAVVSLIALGQGLQDYIDEQFEQVGGNLIIIQSKTIGPPGSTENPELILTKDDLDVVKNINGVEVAEGALVKTVAATFRDETEVILLNGLNEDYLDVFGDIDALEIVEGRQIKDSDRSKVVVGNSHAFGNLWDKPLKIGNKIEISGKKFEVVGVLRRQGNPFDDQSVWMQKEVMADLVGVELEESMIVAKAKEGFSPEEVAETIERKLRRERGEKEGQETFNVQTSSQLLDTFSDIFLVVQAVFVGIAAISLVVGGIGIMNTMYTSVIERTKEIGTMKAVGAKNSDILWLFLIESGMLGLIGGVVGILIGAGIAKGVEYGAMVYLGSVFLRASISVELVVGALLFSFVVGAVSGVLPAMQASRLKPADALRYE